MTEDIYSGVRRGYLGMLSIELEGLEPGASLSKKERDAIYGLAELVTTQPVDSQAVESFLKENKKIFSKEDIRNYPMPRSHNPLTLLLDGINKEWPSLTSAGLLRSASALVDAGFKVIDVGVHKRQPLFTAIDHLPDFNPDGNNSYTVKSVIDLMEKMLEKGGRRLAYLEADKQKALPSQTRLEEGVSGLHLLDSYNIRAVDVLAHKLDGLCGGQIYKTPEIASPINVTHGFALYAAQLERGLTAFVTAARSDNVLYDVDNLLGSARYMVDNFRETLYIHHHLPLNNSSQRLLQMDAIERETEEVRSKVVISGLEDGMKSLERGLAGFPHGNQKEKQHCLARLGHFIDSLDVSFNHKQINAKSDAEYQLPLTYDAFREAFYEKVMKPFASFRRTVPQGQGRDLIDGCAKDLFETCSVLFNADEMQAAAEWKGKEKFPVTALHNASEKLLTSLTATHDKANKFRKSLASRENSCNQETMQVLGKFVKDLDNLIYNVNGRTELLEHLKDAPQATHLLFHNHEFNVVRHEHCYVNSFMEQRREDIKECRLNITSELSDDLGSLTLLKDSLRLEKTNALYGRMSGKDMEQTAKLIAETEKLMENMVKVGSKIEMASIKPASKAIEAIFSKK